MKIIDREDPFKRLCEVYAIYWVWNKELSKYYGQRMHLVIPYEGYHGLLAIAEERCEVIDPSINGFTLRKSSSEEDILVHWAAEKNDLLDRLIDGPDPEAIAELHRRIREDKPPFLD